MMQYRLDVKEQVRTQVRQVPMRIQAEVKQIIVDLRFDPYPPGSEELRDHFTGIWKIKVDGWRIFYTVDEQESVVTIVSVKRRDNKTYISIY